MCTMNAAECAEFFRESLIAQHPRAYSRAPRMPHRADMPNEAPETAIEPARESDRESHSTHSVSDAESDHLPSSNNQLSGILSLIRQALLYQ